MTDNVRDSSWFQALECIAAQQPTTLAMIQRNGFVFATPLGKPDAERTDAERWEKLAFSIYTDLCIVDSVARAALDEAEDSREATQA